MTDAAKKWLDEFIQKEYWYCRQPDGTYCYTMHADYRDQLDDAEVTKLLAEDSPMDALCELLFENWMEAKWHYEDQLMDSIYAAIDKDTTPFPVPLSKDDCGEIQAYIEEIICFDVPMDHYLGQDFCVNIFMDTGDGNHDYVLNGIYPAYCGTYEERIPDKASLLWLAKQQGYTKTALWKATLAKTQATTPFLKSVRTELVNVGSHMNCLTFLVKMPLRQLIQLNEAIQLQDRNGHFYDTTKNPNCGHIVLDKKTMTGLYDLWSGAGSVLEIELEKDVKIPIRFIRSALPDGGDGCSIANVYGMSEKAWEFGEVKEIRVPQKISKIA